MKAEKQKPNQSAGSIEMRSVKFFLPESEDRVDPGYNFETDSYCEKRVRGSDHDVYAHELFDAPQCDGLLVTRSGVSADRHEKIRQAGGIHRYLRFPSEFLIIADCGAFQYRDEEVPPYSCEETCEFYEDLKFDYGISLDHMIFEFDPEYDEGRSLLLKTPSPEMERRFRLTLDNAKKMHRLCASKNYAFKLIGAVQGWSPHSYLRGIQELVNAGVTYLALGGLAKATDLQIRSVLDVIGPFVIESGVELHILGVARLSLLPDYQRANVVSCDSASTILQAFKSNKDNFHTREKKYTAVRIPPATGDLSPKVRKLLKQVESSDGSDAAAKLHRKLINLEEKALASLRSYAVHKLSLDEAMKELTAYEDEFGDERRYYPLFEETLKERPWCSCTCAICQKIGIEVIILRGNNRNRRRGFHNTHVFFEQFKELRDQLALA
ncbi:MAG: hypothetical protein ACI8UO_003232 [Verrucomicrobiales bacterium]|jgi:hypothetical protein